MLSTLKTAFRFASSACLAFACASTAQAQWTNVGTGIDYQRVTITMGDGKPNNVYVARMAVANPNCIINSMIASNRVAGARERPSAMAARCDDAINYWGQAWGQRNDVIIAVNGSFEVGGAAAGIIAGGDIYDGWYASRFGDWGGQMGLVWKFDRSYFIGVCPHYQASGQTVSLGGVSQSFAGINIPRTNNLIIYTPQYNNNTLTDNTGVEVLVGLTTPLKTPSSTVTGTIEQVRINQGSTLIPFDHIVLSGAGSAATYLQTYAQVGRPVQITQNITLYNGPTGDLCSTPDSRDIINAYGLAQGNFNFLVNGSIIPTSNSGMIIRAPRTFLAYNSTYIFFVVCDGRTTQSVGMTSDEMGAFCLTSLAATDAVNLDGGGSSVMLVNGAIQNSPSDGSERPVVNGLMMVNLKPKLLSTVFGAGQTISTTANANLRLGPGTDYYAFTTIANGTQGTVASHSLNGVFAKNYYWWKCNFGANTGWVAESLLATSNSAPAITQQPLNQFVGPGGYASFAVGTSGSNPLAYQWQKNQANLSDGGHYSGSTTATLVINNADSSDAASYRCVVTNAYGSMTSSPATLTLATNAFGSVPLTNIPTLSGDTANDARAITPDGRYVVGLSGSRGFLYDLYTASVVNVLSSDSAQSAILTGVGYRTSGGQRELVMSGLSGGLHTVWKTADSGATWGVKVQGATGKNPTIAAANGLAGTSTDVFYSIWTDEGSGGTDNWTLNVGGYSNSWPATVAWGPKGVGKPDTTQLNGIASKGRAVGWRRNGTTLAYANYVADWQGATTPAVWNFNGLDGTTAGQAFAVSADGTVIFGLSPKAGGTAATNCGYRAVFNTNYPGVATQLSVAQLPNFPDTAGSANLAIPYGCTADGSYAVGMNYRGTEKAVLWDTHDGNATNWTVADLTDLAAAGGNLNIFSRLTRAYCVGTNGTGSLVIAGVGLDTNSPARSRAFLMTVALSNAPVVVRPTVTISGAYPAGFSFSFPTVANSNLTYFLEYTTDLFGAMTWITITSTPGTGAIASLPDPSPSDSQRFYRIRIQ